MTVRYDVTVDWAASPRIITVADTSASITIQDLVDTVRYLEEILADLSFDHLLSAGGKESLGDAAYVGITVTLQNAKLAFAARPAPDFVQCKVYGGNLVAVDEEGDSMFPIQTSAYTQVTLIQSTSPSLIESGVSGLTPEESAKLDHIDEMVDEIDTGVETVDAKVVVVDSKVVAVGTAVEVVDGKVVMVDGKVVSVTKIVKDNQALILAT